MTKLNFLSLSLYKFISRKKNNVFIAGANRIKIELDDQLRDINKVKRLEDYEKYFRPSNLKVLNTNKEVEELINYNNSKTDNMNVLKKFMNRPEDTIINYFSLLREAASPVDGKYVGCGSLGLGKVPYKIAYKFFTKEYQGNVSFKSYEKSFSNILHINLIKFKEVPSFTDNIKCFYEIETIQGSENNIANFTYYYGFVELSKLGDEYKIADINITPENYLCAPYHGWVYDAESKVEIEYGDWCKLVKNMERVERNGYVKNVYFNGTDNRKYKIQFYTLTNDYDIQVAQFIKSSSGEWEKIELDPNDCLKKNMSKYIR